MRNGLFIFKGTLRVVIRDLRPQLVIREGSSSPRPQPDEAEAKAEAEAEAEAKVEAKYM